MTLLIRLEAHYDVLEAAGWYEQRQPGLSLQFVAAISEGFERIATGPARFARGHRELRRALVSKFPYAVYFVE